MVVRALSLTQSSQRSISYRPNPDCVVIDYIYTNHNTNHNTNAAQLVRDCSSGGLSTFKDHTTASAARIRRKITCSVVGSVDGAV
jgi:hypothetical protein